MTYSLTERKRIRKSFAKRAIVQKVPFLIATQLESYPEFLQAHVAPESRRNQGLQAAFTSIFPISSHSGNARLEFVSYSLGEPPFDVKECQQRGLTYASPLRPLRSGGRAVRREERPAARATLREPAAREGAPPHHGKEGPRPPGKGGKE